jgi:hypothetical protein
LSVFQVFPKTETAMACLVLLIRSMRLKLFFLAALLVGFRVHAMDRWSALSQIESGDNDRAVGAAGEISRYQIKPEVWQRFAPTSANWEDQKQALAVAKIIMEQRYADFQRASGRAPTDFEFYVLWNAPARVGKPGSAIAERAQRFSNLVENR